MKRFRQWWIAFLTLDRLAWRMDNHEKMIHVLLGPESRCTRGGKLTRAEIERYVRGL